MFTIFHIEIRLDELNSESLWEYLLPLKELLLKSWGIFNSWIKMHLWKDGKSRLVNI